MHADGCPRIAWQSQGAWVQMPQVIATVERLMRAMGGGSVEITWKAS